MRLLLVAVLPLLAAGPASAEVCLGNVTLTTQFQVNNFNCSRVVGDLRIQGAGIASLAPLSGLTAVEGVLYIDNNPVLGSLNGLEAVFYASALRISRNPALTSLSGLDGLARVGGSIFDSGTVFIADNRRLTSLAGLESLVRVFGDLVISDNTFLESVEGLGALTYVGGAVDIKYNPALTSLVGLENLTSIGIRAGDGSLSIGFNTGLRSLRGLDNLATIAGRLFLEANASLTSLEGLSSLTRANGLDISANPALVSLEGLGPLARTDVLRIAHNRSLTSLSGLGALRSVSLGVTIRDNPSLASMEGLSALFATPTVSIRDNAALVSLDGLESLAFITLSASIRDNPALAECRCGLAGLISGDPPAFNGVIGPILFSNNAPEGQCNSASAVLAATCPAPPPVDTTAPVCGPIVIERNGPGGALSAIASSASDPESGIATVAFTTLRNLRGFVGGAGPYAQGATYTTADPSPAEVSFRGERVSYSAGGALVVRVTNGAGLWRDCDPVVSQLSATAPEAFALEAPYPNPARAGEPVRLALAVAEASEVRLVVYDVAGREVARLVDGALEPGRYEVAWTGADASGGALAAGVYVVRMEAGAFSHSLRVTVLP